MFLVGMFPGPQPPSKMNSFFMPLIDELIQLFNGVQIENCIDTSHHLLKGQLLYVTADMMARKKIQCTVGPNGYYGCFNCETKGEYCTSHVYFPGKSGKIRENKFLQVCNTTLKEYYFVLTLTRESCLDSMACLYFGS